MQTYIPVMSFRKRSSSQLTNSYGSVLLETVLVISVILLLLVSVLDIGYLFSEKAALKEASRLGARVAADAQRNNFDAKEIREIVRLTVESALTSSGLESENYFVDIWGIEKEVGGRRTHNVQVTVSRKPGGRSYLVPESWYLTCAGSTYFMESRLAIEPTGATPKANPDCNPAEAPR